MNDGIEIFRMFNMIMIVENGSKKIINDKEMLNKSDEELIKIYNRKSGV